jgi:hypothetical protein
MDEGMAIEERIAAASDPGTAPEMLAAFARDPEFGVRLAVASNPSTPGDALAVLAEEVNEEYDMDYGDGIESWIDEERAPDASADADPGEDSVRVRVAWNPATPASVLKALAASALISKDIYEDRDALWALCANPSTPAESLMALAENVVSWYESENLAYTFVGNPSTTSEVLDLISHHPLGNTEATPALPYFRLCKLLEHPNVSETLLERALTPFDICYPFDAGPGSFDVEIAGHPAASSHMLEVIFTRCADPIGLRAYGTGDYSTMCSSDLIPFTEMDQAEDWRLRGQATARALAAHANTPSRVLAALAVCPVERVRSTALANPSCPSSLPVDWPTGLQAALDS